MTTMSVSLPARAAPRRAGHFGAWRALSTVPAMIGSLLLLLVLFGWLGEWEPSCCLAGSASGVAVFSRIGERAAVRVGAGFRRPTRAQSALLAPAWSAALARCGLCRGRGRPLRRSAAETRTRSLPVAAVSRSPRGYLRSFQHTGRAMSIWWPS